MSENEDDWSDRERALLAGLAPGDGPSPDVERRVVAAMKERGLIEPSRRSLSWPTLAAAVATLAVGVLVGRVTAGRPATTSGAPPLAQTDGAVPARTFLLLLYPGPSLDPSAAAEQGRVEEYGRWARGLAADGRLVTGEKLKEGVTVFAGVAAPDPSAGALQGFFLIRADTLQEAEGIARTCPHRGHGGAVALREVDPT